MKADDTSSAPSLRFSLYIFLTATAALALHIYYYYPFLSDDGLISLTYARRFLAGDGLTWTDGVRVEGYSNFLWVILISLGGIISSDLVLVARVIGFACILFSFIAFLYLYKPTSAIQILPAAVACLGLAAAAPTAIWILGALESPLIILLLAWAMVFAYRLFDDGDLWHAVTCGCLLGLLNLLRPDAPLFTFGIVIGLTLARGLNRRTIIFGLIIVVLSSLFYMGHLGFRWTYYHEWVPNTAHAKLGFTAQRFFEGFDYLKMWLYSIHQPIAVAFIIVGAYLGDQNCRRRMLLALCPLVLWIAYITAIGGDHLQSFRRLLPSWVLLLFIFAEAIRGFIQWTEIARPDARVAGKRVIAFISVTYIGMLAFMQVRNPQNRRALDEQWTRTAVPVGAYLRERFAGNLTPLIAADPVGSIAYYTDFPVVDMLGINDLWLARNPPGDFGQGALGHELGNGSYILNREPDIIIFCKPEGSAVPCFRSGEEMLAMDEFHEKYHLEQTFITHETAIGRETIELAWWVKRKISDQ